jgi:hypothetical protein
MITRIARHRSAHRAFCQSVNAKLTVPDGRYRRFGADLCRTFLMTDRRCRQRSQNTRFPRRLVDRRLGVKNCNLSDGRF